MTAAGLAVRYSIWPTGSHTVVKEAVLAIGFHVALATRNIPVLPQGFDVFFNGAPLLPAESRGQPLGQLAGVAPHTQTRSGALSSR